MDRNYPPYRPQPGGYHYREGLTAAPPTAARRSKMYRPNSPLTWSFAVAALLQAIVALTLEAYVFGKFQASLIDGAENTTQSRTIPCYLAVFMFGYLYQLVLVYDALRVQNTIQAIGLVFYNLGILVYAAIQMDQIREAVQTLLTENEIVQGFWSAVEPILIALPCLMGLGTVVLAYLAWRLITEFGWNIYKEIGADRRLRRIYLTYQIYIALLKFDFFFFIGFTVQFLVVVQHTSHLELGLTVAVLVVTFFLLLLAAYWVQKESVIGMIIVIFFYLCALAYFLFKLVRMYAASGERVLDYLPARRSLTSFAIITVLLMVITIVVAFMCTLNFKAGLHQYFMKKKAGGGAGPAKEYSTEMPALSGPTPSRMTID